MSARWNRYAPLRPGSLCAGFRVPAATQRDKVALSTSRIVQASADPMRSGCVMGAGPVDLAAIGAVDEAVHVGAAGFVPNLVAALGVELGGVWLRCHVTHVTIEQCSL